MRTIIRLALTGFILFMVYRETGPWTVVAFALIFLGTELSALVFAADKGGPKR